MAATGSAEDVALAALLALMAAAFLFAAQIVGLGFLADFLSRTVLVGFLTGVGIQVALATCRGSKRGHVARLCRPLQWPFQ
jgi:SulP family sulfate permease